MVSQVEYLDAIRRYINSIFKSIFIFRNIMYILAILDIWPRERPFDRPPFECASTFSFSVTCIRTIASTTCIYVFWRSFSLDSTFKSKEVPIYLLYLLLNSIEFVPRPRANLLVTRLRYMAPWTDWRFLPFWHFLATFWPILILGQFVISPYSNIFWLVQRFRRR